MNEKALQSLYDEMSALYDIGSFEDFKEYLSDDKQRNAFFEEAIKPNYDVASLDEFDSTYGLKKKEDFISEDPESESELDKDFSGIPIFKFISDAVGRGVAQGNTTDEALGLLMSGNSATEDEINEYIKAVQAMESYAPSEAMNEFQKDYIENGSDFGAFLSALGSNLSIAPEILLQSFAGMATAATTAEGAALAGAGAGIGAAAGAPIFGVGAVAGGLVGGMAAANGALETATSLTEFIKEKLDEDGKEFNAENVRSILNDEDSFTDIKLKALARGGIISAIDLIGGGVAGRAVKGVSQISKKGAKLTKLGQVGTGVAIEGASGSLGEAAAMGATGQELDAAEIGLEGIAGFTTAPVSILSAMKQSTYKLKKDGQEISLSREKFQKKVEEDPSILTEYEVEIKNAPEGEKEKYDAIKKKEKIKKELPDNIPDESKEAISDLELEAESLSNKKSISAKQRLKAIEEEISALAFPSKEKKEQLSIEQKIQNFARKVTVEGKENFTEDEEIFFAEYSEEIDAAITEGRKNIKRDQSKIRSLAQKIYGGAKEFTDQEIDFYSQYQEEVDNQLESISTTERSKTKEVAYTLPENPKEARKDFEIIDNRDGSTTNIDEEGNGKWIVVNKKTGKLVETKTKKDAEILAKNPRENWDYGEGDMIEVEAEPVIGSAEAKNIIESLKKKREKESVNVYSALKDQIRLEARAAREKKYDMDKARTNVAEKISEFSKNGLMTSKQALSLVRRISKVNLDNPVKVEEVVSYAEKVLDNADNAQKLLQAESLKRSIRKGNKRIEATVKGAVKEFLKINPNLVENVDQYVALADLVSKGIKKSTTRKGEVKLSSDVNLKKLSEYISKELPRQTQIREQATIKKYENILGEKAEGMSYQEMKDAVAAMKEEDNSVDVKAQQDEAIKSIFEEITESVNEVIDLGRGAPEVDDVYEVTDMQKALIKRFTSMDLDLLTTKESLEAVDALKNFLVNGTTGGMMKILSNFEGRSASRRLLGEGLSGHKLKYASRIWGKNLATLNILSEFIFRGQTKGLKFFQESGLQGIVNGNSKAIKDHEVIQKEYDSAYVDKKANGEAFTSPYNIIERGMMAFSIRNLQGTIQEQIDEFSRRKNLILQSIESLRRQGGEASKKADLYQQAYDKLLDDSVNSDEVVSKVDSTNKEAVDWWIDKWSNIYPDLYDVSLNVYNRLLTKDSNYTPDFFKVGKAEVEQDLLNPGFQENTASVLYDKESRTLKETVRPKTLDTQNASFVELNFDRANMSAYKAALVDINTAESISTIDGFVKDPSFKSMIQHDETRELFKDRIFSYVRNIKGGNVPTKADERKAAEILNKVATFSVGRALGGPTQFIKQMVPVVNTLINAGDLSISAFQKLGAKEFIMNSGYAIASRGFASISEIENLSTSMKNIERVNNKLLNSAGKINRKMLKLFVQKPDRIAAHVSWLTYYIKSLKAQGFSTEAIDNVDWETHKLNTEAADYAQQQVDRQQNVSDAALQGDFFASRKLGVSLARKIVAPFMNFAINQKSRMYSDIMQISSKLATEEDKARAKASLSGLAVESLTFNALGFGISMGLYAATKSLTGGEEESEEDHLRRVNGILKGRATNIASDIFSPFPALTDSFVIPSINLVLKTIQEGEEKDMFLLFSRDEKEFSDQLGVFGIGLKAAKELYEIQSIALTGKYDSRYGKEVQLDSRAQEIASTVFLTKLLYASGLAPVEVGTMSNYAMREAKKLKVKKSSGTSKYKRTYKY